MSDAANNNETERAMDINKIAKDNGTDCNPSPFGFAIAPTHSNRVDIELQRGRYTNASWAKGKCYPSLIGETVKWSKP
jgi:hypothetical protein